MNRDLVTALALSAALLSGCSSRPRSFKPELAAQPADTAAYDTALATCEARTAGLGGKSASDRIGTGASTAVFGGGVASGASWGAAAAVGGAAIISAPVVGLFWGISRANRAKKEKRIKAASAQCLQEQGYTVAGWKRVKRSHNAKAAPSGQDRTELAIEEASLDAVQPPRIAP